MAKKAAKKAAKKPRKTSAPRKRPPRLDLQMTRSNSVTTIALDKTETFKFTFDDRDPVTLKCSQIWEM